MGSGRRHKKRTAGIALAVLLAVVAGCVFCAWKAAGRQRGESADTPATESHIRLVRSEIPQMPPMSRMSYSEIFSDMNDVQIEAAKRNGLRNPDMLSNPDNSAELVKVETCEAYAMDSLRHSKPYLVPQAEKLLMYIGHRFDEIQTEYGVKRKVRPIVTSLLRSRRDVGRLRRVNSNATENSCHLYGTTFDISYTRFMDEDGNVVASNSKYKELLAKALYELRFEGLCYVRYERRQPCFHITVRSVDYEGDLVSESVEYVGGEQPTVTVGPVRPDETGVRENPTVTSSKAEPSETTVKPKPRTKNPDTASAAVGRSGAEKTTPVKSSNTVRGRSREFEHKGNYVFD